MADIAGATPWGAIAGAGIGAIGSIYGAIKAGKQRNKINSFIGQQEAENEAKYNRDYYGDYLQRADSQAVMKQMRDTLRDKNKQNQSTAAITGATPEAQLAQMESTNKAVGNTMSQLGAMGAQFKDRVDDRYMARKEALSNMRYGNMNSSAQSAENLFSNSVGLAGKSVSGLFSEAGKTKQ